MPGVEHATHLGILVQRSSHAKARLRGKASYGVAGVVTASAFGPYLGGGIRTEQAIVYGLAGFGLLHKWSRLRPNYAGAIALTLLSVEWAVAVTGAVAPALNLTPWPRGSLIAGLDNLTLPIAVLVVAWMLCVDGDRRQLLRVVCKVLVVAMCVNSLAAFSSQFFDLSWLFAHFWTGSGAVDGTTVAGRSAQLGRLTGLINQPIEAGALASLAMLASIYLYRATPWRLAFIGSLIAVGGILSVSKLFVLVGLPIGVGLVLFRGDSWYGRLRAVSAVVGCFFIAVQMNLVPAWSGSDFLLRLFRGQEGRSSVDLYTSGRLGSSSTLGAEWSAIIHYQPWFGFGAAGLGTPADNGWIQSMAFAGIVGFAAYTGVLATACWVWWRRRGLKATDSAVRWLTGGLMLVLIIGSVGGPILTLNRCTTIVFLLLGLTLFAPQSGDPCASASAGRRAIIDAEPRATEWTGDQPTSRCQPPAVSMGVPSPCSSERLSSGSSCDAGQSRAPDRSSS